MQKNFLFQVYTNLEYFLPTYRIVLKPWFLMINKNLRKSLGRKNINEILI